VTPLCALVGQRDRYHFESQPVGIEQVVRADADVEKVYRGVAGTPARAIPMAWAGVSVRWWSRR
jgi:hypothetical protein